MSTTYEPTEVRDRVQRYSADLTGVPQIPARLHELLSRGIEPTAEEEEAGGEAIAAACREIRTRLASSGRLIGLGPAKRAAREVLVREELAVPRPLSDWAELGEGEDD